MDFQSLLTILFLTLIVLVVVVVFVPAGLERRANHNRAARQRYTTEMRAIEGDARQLKQTLALYRRVQSDAYRNALSAATGRLAALDAHLAAAARLLDGVIAPEIFDYLLPAQHFILFPRDIGAVAGDTRQLGRARSELQVAAAALVEAEAVVTALALLPGRLASERAALETRLDRLNETLSRERADGIIALVDCDDDAARARSLLAEQAAVARDGPLRDQDAGAALLATAAPLIDDLEATVAGLVRQREQLDEHLRRAAAGLDDAQVGSKTGPEATDAPPPLKPLLRRAALLLNETAPDHRRRRDFDAAHAAIAAAEHLIATSRDLAAADQVARQLARRDDGVSLNEPIAAYRREVDTALGDLVGQGAAERVDDAFVARAAGLHRKGEILLGRQNEVIAGLEREAGAVRQRVARDWEASRSLLALDGDDPLARRYERLLARYEEARRSPAALEQFRQEATDFERTLNPWMARLVATHERISRNRVALPELIDVALATAGPWQALGEHVTFIKQRVADFETARSHFAQATRRRDAERLMDELEAVEREVAARLALLQDQATRLRFLEADVDQIVAMTGTEAAALTPDHPDWAKQERMRQLIAHHKTTAHTAKRYEDASLALSRAADLANKLL
jgi:hypothetical protein